MPPNPKPNTIVPPAGARVGVFWVHEGRVLADLLPVAKGVKYEGVVNGRRDHIEVWPEFQRRVPSLRDVDYIEVPRGRVQFWSTTGTFVVLFDRVLATPGVKADLCATFGLPHRQVRFRFDPHYTTNPEALDRLFSS